MQHQEVKMVIFLENMCMTMAKKSGREMFCGSYNNNVADDSIKVKTIVIASQMMKMMDLHH